MRRDEIAPDWCTNWNVSVQNGMRLPKVRVHLNRLHVLDSRLSFLYGYTSDYTPCATRFWRVAWSIPGAFYHSLYCLSEFMRFIANEHLLVRIPCETKQWDTGEWLQLSVFHHESTLASWNLREDNQLVKYCKLTPFSGNSVWDQTVRYWRVLTVECVSSRIDAR